MLVTYSPTFGGTLHPVIMPFDRAMSLIHEDAMVCWDRDLSDIAIVDPKYHDAEAIRIYGTPTRHGGILAYAFTGDAGCTMSFIADPVAHWMSSRKLTNEELTDDELFNVRRD